jgi:hypothetical protein
MATEDTDNTTSPPTTRSIGGTWGGLHEVPLPDAGSTVAVVGMRTNTDRTELYLTDSAFVWTCTVDWVGEISPFILGHPDQAEAIERILGWR